MLDVLFLLKLDKSLTHTNISFAVSKLGTRKPLGITQNKC